MEYKVGEIFWVNTNRKFSHPHIIIKTSNQLKAVVTVCKITTNQKKSYLPGNIILEIGEGNLPKPSIIDVSDVSDIQIRNLGEFIGVLSEHRVEEIWQGIRFLERTYFSRKPKTI